MLVLSRFINEEIVIQCGDEIISVILVDIRGPEKVRLGFVAKPHVKIHRREIWDANERKERNELKQKLIARGIDIGAVTNIEVQPDAEQVAEQVNGIQ